MQTRLLFVCAVLILVSSACSSKRQTPATNPQDALSVSSTPPFSTKEPERYQATRTLTTTLQNGNVIVRKVLLARDGPFRREEYSDPDLPNIVYLYLPTGNFVVGPGEKIFSEVVHGETGATTAVADQLEGSTDQLAQLRFGQTAYQRLGPDTVDGRATMKFRVVVNNAESETVSTSEGTVWIDESLGIPVKTEMKQANGSVDTMQLSDIKLEVDRRVFQVPEGFQKLEITELRRRLKR
jgi:outer membrane lipoprotein-sorting protein